MSEYSEIFILSSELLPREKTLSNGRKIYAQRFTAAAADIDTGYVMRLAAAIRTGAGDVEHIGFALKWHRIESSLCEKDGGAVDPKVFADWRKDRRPEVHELVKEIYDFVQEVNEVGNYRPKKTDENGNVEIDEETNAPKL